MTHRKNIQKSYCRDSSLEFFTPFNISNADPEGRHLLMLLGNCYFSPINRLYILIILPEGRIIKYNRRLKGVYKAS